jgi:hypothetical protein
MHIIRFDVVRHMRSVFTKSIFNFNVSNHLAEFSRGVNVARNSH